MRNILISLFLILGLSANFATAEEATVPEFGTIFQFSTDEEASVVSAFGAFAQSECRKSLPAAIRVMGEYWNGNEEATHSVIWNFADAQSITNTFSKLGECREWADFLSVLSKNSQQHSQQMVRTLSAGGDYTKDTTYSVWQMNVTDETAYLREYNRMMNAQLKAGVINGAWGLWRVQGGADENVTHIAYTGAANLESLLANGNPSKAYIAFQKKVAGIRTIYRSNINSVIADL